MTSQTTRDDLTKTEHTQRKLVPDDSIPKIRTYDLRISTYNPTVRSGFDVRPELGCRIIHPNTGIEVTAEDERSPHKAKAAAMEKFEKAWIAYWTAKPDYPIDVEKLVIDYMMANSHPDMTNTGAYIVFISEDKVKSVGKQVAHVLREQTPTQAVRERIALEIESQLFKSNNALFRSGLKIAAGIAREGVSNLEHEAMRAAVAEGVKRGVAQIDALNIMSAYLQAAHSKGLKQVAKELADEPYFGNDGAERT